MLRVKKNDTVIILAGKDKGKQGSVVDILLKKGKVLVGGLGKVKRHTKARKQGETPMIKDKESYLSMSKVMPVCPSCNKPCRISIQLSETGDKARVCNRCKKNI